MKKRILSALLTLALVLTLVPAAFAAQARDLGTNGLSLDEAANAYGGTIHFVSAGEYAWTVARDFVASGNAGVPNSVSTMTANVTLENDAQLSFRYMACGEGSDTYWDVCEFYVDDTCMLNKGALDDNWHDFSCMLSAGEHLLTWSYTKDTGTDPVGDFFAIDEVKLVNTVNASYGLRIRGEMIDDGSLSGEGYVFYPDTNTLQIYDDIYYAYGSAIESTIDGLTIVVGGDCTVSSDSNYGTIYVTGNTDITGVGKLTVLNSAEGAAIEVGSGADLVIDGAFVDAKSADGKYAITANVTSSCLSIAISDVVADSCESAVYGFFDRVFLAGECISEPEGGYASGFQIYDSLGEPATRVHFSRAYTSIGAYGYYDYGENGLQDYLFSANAGDTSLYGYGAPGPEDVRIFSGAYAEGYYYGYGFDGDETTYYTIPLLGNGGDWVASPDATPDVPISISYDYRRGSLYGIATYIEMAGDRGLVQIDRTTGATTVIGTLDHMYVAMACTDIGGGACYAVDFDGDVYRIDLETAEETYLFSTGVLCCGQQDLAYDYDTRTLYWLQYNEYYDNDMGMYMPEGGLYIIDVVMQKCYYLGTIADGVEATGAVVMPEFDSSTNYAIRFDANGGKADKAMIFNDDIDRTFPTATGNGAFLGWFTEREGGYQLEDSGVVTEDLVLYAHYEGGSGGFLKGDFDGDGVITVADALAALRIAVGLAPLTEEALTIGDLDGDGAITVSDALRILRVAARLAEEETL